VGRIVKPTAEHGERRGMYRSCAHQVHTMHADIERQKRRDRSGTIDKQGACASVICPEIL